MFVLFFDGVLAVLRVRAVRPLCILQPAAARAWRWSTTATSTPATTSSSRAHLLGNILQTPLAELVSSEKQRAFGRPKAETLPRYCRECRFLFTCHGECPKNRVLTTADGEPGLNWLCAGLKAFFEHSGQPMRIMADLLKRGRPAAEVMAILAGEEQRAAQERAQQFALAGRNDPCPCGSGKKFKRCHGASVAP